jgi:RNA polymerase sigma-70 factor (ECF subfamily)
MGDMTFSDVERLGAALGEADEALHMDEDAFRLFYERTARPVWAYLARMIGDTRLADDLLQETYYRFLRADAAHEDEAHRRNYLFRIATNLVHDHRRRARSEPMSVVNDTTEVRGSDVATRVAERVDVSRAFARLKPRERQLLWLAYANGSSHEEIAAALGLKKTSIKLLLFRARRRMAALLGRGEAREQQE